MAAVVSNIQGLKPLLQNLPKNEFAKMVEKEKVKNYLKTC